jgi:hypothetical protein
VFDAGGTPGYIDTLVHEYVHVFVGKYLPWITEVGYLTAFRIPIGAPVMYLEELFAYSLGHLAAGRLFAIPLAPLEAFTSLTLAESATTLLFFSGLGIGIYMYNR